MNIHTQFENAGDALILRELIRLISQRVPAEVYLGQAPDSFIEQLGIAGNGNVTAHRKGASVALIRDMARARCAGWRCYLFLTPGAPNGEKTMKQFILELLRLSIFVALTASGVRICQVGVSAENIGPRHARILRWRSRLLYASAPRERIAFDYAQQLGIRVTGLMPDLAFNTFLDSPAECLSRRGIGFSFRVDKDPTIRAQLTDVVKAICESSAVAGDELVFVAQVGRDVEFMRQLASLAAELRPGQTRFVDCHLNIEDAFAAYATCRAVFSNRLHALLPSLKEGASPVALTIPELDPKILGVFDSIGLGDRVFDIRTVNPSELERWMTPVAFDGRAVANDLNRFFDELMGVDSEMRSNADPGSL